MRMKTKNIIPINVLLFILITSCASTGSGTGSLSLQEAIEQSAEKIAAELPDGSRVAIVAFESGNVNLSDYIMAELSSALFDRGLEVADRQNLAFVYKELNFNMSGAVSDETAQSIGKMLGAQLVITGSLTNLGGSYRYRTNAIHVEQATRASDTRLTVRNDREMKNMVTALANQSSTARRVEYDQEEQSTPKSAGSLLDRGLLFASRGEYDMAITDFTDAININPNLAAAYFNRGNAYHNIKDYDKAIADYIHAIRLNPNDAAAYMFRGYAYFAKDDHDQAIADYSQAIRLDPNYADAYINRGNSYFTKWSYVGETNTADYNRAISDYNQAIRINPTAWRYATRGNAYFAKGDYDKAIADYSQTIRLGPTAWRYTERGNAYFAKGDYDKAIADYSQAIKLGPTTWRYNIRGDVYYYGKRNYDLAIADYTQAMELEPGSGRYMQLVNFYLKKGDYASAARPFLNHANRVYRMQVGAFATPALAQKQFEWVKDVGLNPVYEQYGRMYRVVIPGIQGIDMQMTFEKIATAGFSEVWVRLER
jgi:tetratricopeptide (TPR) repeat protein